MGGLASKRKAKTTQSTAEKKLLTTHRKPSLKSFLTPSNNMNIWEKYSRHRKLGCGMCGPVYVVKNRQTGMAYAGKSVRKNALNASFNQDLKTEIAILKQLDHPNVVKLVETIEDEDNVYMVLELCTGGELFEYVTNARYSEGKAAHIFCSMVRAVHYCHCAGICHRDLKLENFLFESDVDEMPQIKLIDFGLSAKYCVRGLLRRMTSMVGTSYYMSPEVIQRKGYTKSSDIWAMGVILYMLLSGRPPFNGSSDADILRETSSATLAFGPFWKGISPNAKRLVQKILVKNPANRLTAEEILSHPWITMHVDAGVGLERETGKDVVERLQRFNTFSSFKRLSLEVIAMLVLPRQVKKMRNAFNRIDTDKTGVISLREFERAMRGSTELADTDVPAIFNAVDMGRNGVITYTEFIAATLTYGDYIQEERLNEAFARLDVDNSGHITLANLKKCTGNAYTEKQLRDILKEVDIAGDDVISTKEFRVAIKQELMEANDECNSKFPKTMHALRVLCPDHSKPNLHKAKTPTNTETMNTDTDTDTDAGATDSVVVYPAAAAMT